MIREAGQIEPAARDLLAELAAPAFVAVLAQPLELASSYDVCRREQRPGNRVDAADVRNIQVRRLHRLPPQLGVEVETARLEALVLFVLFLCRFLLLRVDGELVRIPAITRVAAIDVDRAENSKGARRCNLVLEVEARQSRMVDFDVDLHFFRQPVALQEGIYRGHVVVVLVLGRLEGLGLDENRAFEADLVLVLYHHRQEPAVLVELPAQIRIQQRVITLAATPQLVVLAAQSMGGFETAAHLRRGPRKDLGVRGSGGATSITWMTEEAGRTPQQLHACRGHFLRHPLLDLPQALVVLLQGRRRGHRIHVMKREITYSQARVEIERGLELRVRHSLRHGCAQPGAAQRSAAEHVGTRPVEGVPVAYGGLLPIFHALAEYDPIFVIDAISEIAQGGGPYEEKGHNA